MTANTDLHRDLVMPLMIDKKVQILKRNLDRFPKGKCRNFVSQFVKEIIALNMGRNHAIHGFWGWEAVKGSYKSAAYSYKADKPLYADEISPLADRIAKATIAGHKAIYELSGGDSDTLKHPCNFFFGAGPPDEHLPGSNMQPYTGSP